MISTFPVLYSTLDSEALKSLVLSQYPLKTVQSCQFWCRGLSDVYLVTTAEEQYILRVSHHHWRTETEINFELEFLNFLHSHQLPVSYPLSTKEGRLLIGIIAPEGARYAVLFTYAPGDIPLGDFNPRQSHQLGKTMAQIHQVGLKFQSSFTRPFLDLDYLVEQSYQTIAPFLDHRESDLAYLDQVTTEIKERLTHLPIASPYWSICWGDPHSGNTHFTADDQVTLFDFDQCGYGWRAFDIAKFWQITLRTGMSRLVREAFLKGYEEVEAIADEEFYALQPLIATAHLWSWAISLNRACFSSYYQLDEVYFTQRLRQLKSFQSHDWQLF